MRKGILQSIGPVSPLPIALLLLCGGARLSGQATALPVLAAEHGSSAGAEDAGALSRSQRITLVLTLAATPERQRALDRFLEDLRNPRSARYHHWVTPAQFGTEHGATAAELGAARTWLEARGLSVESVSASRSRLKVSGFVPEVEAAFGTRLRQFRVGGGLFFGNESTASAGADAAGLFAAVDGLDNLPRGSRPIPAAAKAPGSGALTAEVAAGAQSSFEAFVDAADEDASGVLAVEADASSAELSASELTAWRAAFQQAAAQGITTVVYGGGALQGLADVTGVAVGDPAPDLPSSQRPKWQNAAGLPFDTMRHAPDLRVSSEAAFAQALALIARKTGGRLGNINSTLYALAPLPGLFSQPDGAATGTWEAGTGLGVVDTAQLAQLFPNGLGTSTISLSSSANAPTHGQSFVLTATMTSTNGGPVPTGTITFSAPQTGFVSSTTALSGTGVGVSQSYLLPGATYAITATYSGDNLYAATNSTITITVQPEAALLMISAPATVSLGSTVTAVVTLSSASGVGTPNASVMVTPSGITGATSITQTLLGANGTATASYTFTTKQAGNVALQASCTSNDSSFSCYTPQTVTTTVPQATPTVSLTVMPMPVTAGMPVTLSASVKGVAGTGLTGSVQFFDGNTSLGFGSAPTATWNGNLATGASHVLTAVYQGDSNYLKATSNVVNTAVGTASTTTTVNASAVTAAFGQNITLNITVGTTAVVNGTQPTGSLTFSGAGTLTTAAVSGGAANVTLSSLPVGTYTIATSYSGDTNYSASTGNTVTLTVTQATATLATSLSSTSFQTGTTSTLTVTVTLPGNATLPPGTMFLGTIVGLAGASYPGTFLVNTGGNTGTGSVVIPAPVAGSYQLQVTCATNANFTCTPNSLSISSTAVGVGSTGTTPTMTALAISPLAPAVGQTITLTATISAAAAAVAANPLAGTVNFFDGKMQVGTGTVALVGANAVASATITLTGSTAPHSLTAVYAGNAVYAASTSPAVGVTLSAAAAAVSLTSNVTGGLAGNNVVLTATVTGSTATGSAGTGTVSFYLVGATPALIGTASLGLAGNGVAVAVFSTSNLPSGTTTIYATYNGDSNFSSAVSNQITVGVSDYALSFVPQTLTLSRGQSGSTTVVIALINSFPGQVVVGCTAPPASLMTCSFNPIVITGGGPTTLTVTTAAPRTAGLAGGHGLAQVAGGVSLAGLLGLGFVRRGRWRVPGLLLGMFGMVLLGNVGCGSGNFATPASMVSGGTPLGTVLLNITTVGTDGANTIRHNYNFQVTVQ